MNDIVETVLEAFYEAAEKEGYKPGDGLEEFRASDPVVTPGEIDAVLAEVKAARLKQEIIAKIAPILKQVIRAGIQSLK